MPTSDTHSAKQLHLSPTFFVFQLFGSRFVYTCEQLWIILFAYIIFIFNKEDRGRP